MKEKTIVIRIEEPWTMTHTKSVEDLIDLVKKSLKPSDPLYGKDIYVSATHDHEKRLLIENDTDDTYAVVSIIHNPEEKGYYSVTTKEITTRHELAEMLHNDHLECAKYWNDFK